MDREAPTERRAALNGGVRGQIPGIYELKYIYIYIYIYTEIDMKSSFVYPPPCLWHVRRTVLQYWSV